MIQKQGNQQSRTRFEQLCFFQSSRAVKFRRSIFVLLFILIGSLVAGCVLSEYVHNGKQYVMADEQIRYYKETITNIDRMKSKLKAQGVEEYEIYRQSCDAFNLAAQNAPITHFTETTPARRLLAEDAREECKRYNEKKPRVWDGKW